ncbi:hypothetical protein O6H91_01G135400 [Diphasiastrum complanatum]|uniref:Uncharacterized protein n=1 Tax=Diphasiastrum complanatum TaxID=34168 RepID=A0ACC2EWB6_DIPCM|nr:hypothetical protein O6H91_01G135400 [Diphasiastrum complanatum]
MARCVSERERERGAMEEMSEGVANIKLYEEAQNKKNRIQVSNTKKPLFFYVNLAKRYLQQYEEVELSALGMAIATVVTVAEILKNNGLAVEKKIWTSTVYIRDETRGRVQKAKVLELCSIFKQLNRWRLYWGNLLSSMS